MHKHFRHRPAMAAAAWQLQLDKSFGWISVLERQKVQGLCCYREKTSRLRNSIFRHLIRSNQVALDWPLSTTWHNDAPRVVRLTLPSRA